MHVVPNETGDDKIKIFSNGSRSIENLSVEVLISGHNGFDHTESHVQMTENIFTSTNPKVTYDLTWLVDILKISLSKKIQ